MVLQQSGILVAVGAAPSSSHSSKKDLQKAQASYCQQAWRGHKDLYTTLQGTQQTCSPLQTSPTHVMVAPCHFAGCLLGPGKQCLEGGCPTVLATPVQRTSPNRISKVRPCRSRALGDSVLCSHRARTLSMANKFRSGEPKNPGPRR
jgi:hypothetical protein